MRLHISQISRILLLISVALCMHSAVYAVTYTGSFTNGLVVKENDAVVENANITNGSGGICLKITGDNVTVKNSVIHDCKDHGVQFNGTNGGILENSEVYRAAMMYAPNTLSGGWPSLVKVQSVDETAAGLAQNIVIRNNYIHEGYGECMGLRGSHINVVGNHVKDCYSVGIYSNSDNTLVQKNFVECTGNPEFNRSGYPMAGIGFAEETFTNWGAHGHESQTVLNNIVSGCKYGVSYGTSSNNQGLANSTIAFNTIYKTISTPVRITYYSSQTNNKIENNIAASVNANSSGITITGNVPYTFASWSKPSDFALGTSLPAQGSYTVPEDYTGASRTSPLDAGAMEYGSNGSTPIQSPTSTVNPTPVKQPGDASGDGKVDETDYGIWLSHYGQTVSGGAAVGDFDGNTFVDGIDYTVWLKYYGI